MKLSAALVSGALSAGPCLAGQDIFSLFPIENYSQNISAVISPNDADYDQPLMDEATQKKRIADFYAHWFGEFSPWDAGFVRQLPLST